MANTISMQVETARSVAKQLENYAHTIDDSTDALYSSLARLRFDWQGGSSDEFIAEFRGLTQILANKYADLVVLIQRLNHEINEWEAADKFNSLTLGALGIAGGGAVLGASTGGLAGTAVVSPFGHIMLKMEYGSLSWQDKFLEEARLPKHIADLERQLSELPSKEKIGENIALLDKQIAEWEARKLEMEAEAAKWTNKIPANWQGDSASKIYAEEVIRCEEQIAFLKGRKAGFEASLTDRNSIENQLIDANQRQAALSEVINEGIPSSGSSSNQIKNNLGGCTNYVAGKTNIEGFNNPGSMNANKWNDNAIAAGYEVGSHPVKGSIMVFEADGGVNNGVMNVDNTAGHVAYVESVKKVDGGYEVTISHADTKYVDGKYVAGTYINARTSTITVPDGSAGVSFIYDKPK